MGLNTIKDVQKRTLLAKFFQTSLVARRLLLFVAMLGTCMLIGDGILTPAISGLVTIIFFLFYHVSERLNSLFVTLKCFDLTLLNLFSVLSAMDGLRAPFPSVSKCKFWSSNGFTVTWYFAASINGNCRSY